ncbi:MAG: Maf-like protein [Bacteroidales bacterium]|nr:Maf-like protein [Bacteroidales bacterium]
MLENLDNYKILLASNSPRRRELLEGIDINYNVVTIPDIDESYPKELKGEKIPEYIAKKKADAYLSLLDNGTIIITADTVVILDGVIYGKPKDEQDAINMLLQLSGKTHKVITGVCIRSKEKEVLFSSISSVTFAKLTLDEIKYYVSLYKPFDKAGSYGIQEWIGYIAVERIEGSYFNIMGLPIQKLYTELKKF